MSDFFPGKEEKKVEYIELIYDLIFVYLIGRNNSLLHAIQDGFIQPGAFLTYILSTLVILHVWYFSMLFINRYGANDLAEHLCIFINMYLLYYMGDGTQVQLGGLLCPVQRGLGPHPGEPGGAVLSQVPGGGKGSPLGVRPHQVPDRPDPDPGGHRGGGSPPSS